jgi:hypothetical protein
VALSSSVEESERMYSGTSSVPKISSGSKSRLKTKKGELWDCNREQKEGLTENLLSNGAFLWWSAALLDGLLSLVHHGLGVFFLWSRERRCEVMEVYASGFAEHQGGYFISCEKALGVMTGWRTLWEYRTAGFFLRMRRVFIEQCSWFLDWGFSVDSTPRDRSFCVFG